ncbi:MAG: helix-turn-helix transcriptional regulator [Anaerolineae bacterium]|nr:helix-turn-helix transcriptional regulator [Anaerolineae bacterium]
MPVTQDPITETTFFILLSLAPASKHGYAIMKEVDRLSDGRVALSTGTLYGALKRLLGQGWIERTDDPEPDLSERSRKFYSLTDQGHKVLKSEVERMKNLVKLVDYQWIGGKS